MVTHDPDTEDLFRRLADVNADLADRHERARVASAQFNALTEKHDSRLGNYFPELVNAQRFNPDIPPVPDEKTDELISQFQACRAELRGRPQLPWEIRIGKQFRQDLFSGQLSIMTCYAAASRSNGQPGGITRFGADLYDQGVVSPVTNVNYGYALSDPWLIHNHPFFPSLIRNRIVVDWGTGSGKRLVEGLDKHGPAAFVVAIDNVPINLELAKRELARRGIPFLALNEEFYNNSRLWSHPIWPFLIGTGLPQTHLSLGGTSWNTAAENTINMWANIAGVTRTPPTAGGPHMLAVSANMKQNNEGDRESYLTPGYRQFYLGGLQYGYVITGLYVSFIDINGKPEDLPYEVVSDGRGGWQTQLRADDEKPHYIMFSSPFTGLPPKILHRFDGPLRATKLLRPSVDIVMGMAKASGWAKITLPGHWVGEPTLPYRPAGTPADLGIFVFTPQ